MKEEMDKTKSAQVAVSRKALEHNFTVLNDFVDADTKIAPVIKANAYGHGLTETAKVLAEAGADWFCVISADEALSLRSAGIEKPILILDMVSKSDLPNLIEKRIRLMVPSRTYASRVESAAQKTEKKALIHAKVDTGMSRYGVAFNDAGSFFQVLRELSNVKTEGVMTHFATADEKNSEQLQKQLTDFQKIAEEFPVTHCANSATTFLYPDAHFDMVRPGIAIYGYYPSDYVCREVKEQGKTLRSALSFTTQIRQVKTLPEGANVGYGATYTTKRETKIAILPVGYYDGVDRLLGNKGEVLIGGKRAPIIGRVCMNLTIVDVTDISSVAVGDEAVLIGEQGGERIDAKEIAEKIHTIPYEIITRIRETIPRYYAG